MYAALFPPDIPFLQARIWLSPWIEDNILNMKTGDAESQVLVAQQLLEQIQTKTVELGHMVGDPEKQAARESLLVVHRGLLNHFSTNVQQLFVTVQQCLQQELGIVDKCLDPKIEQAQIRKTIAMLKQKNNETEELMRACKSEMEILTSDIYHFRGLEAQYVELSKQNGENNPEMKKMKANVDKVKQQVQQKYGNMSQRRGELVNVMVNNYRQIQELQTHVLDKELIAWKREQQLSGNGKSMTLSLEVL